MVMPKWSRLVIIENRVVSCPPCCELLQVNTAPGLPISAPDAHKPPQVSRNEASWLGRRPKRVGAPSTRPS